MVRVLVGILALLIVAIAAVLFLRPSAAPWTPSGRVAIVVYAVPTADRSEARIFGVGIDDVLFTSTAGATERASMLTRRVQLSSDRISRYLVLEADTAVGSYSTIRFSMKSPEVRNDWQGNAPAESVQPVSEEIELAVPYEVAGGETTAILIGIETFQALHEENGVLLYLPVFQTETRTGATIIKEAGDTVSIEGGVIVGSATYGMDWSGEVRYNFRAPAMRPETAPPLRAEPPVDAAPDEAAAGTRMYQRELLATSTVGAASSLGE